MVTRYNFYQSKEWRTLLKILRSERIDSNGNIICEYCGKPIVNKFDCIGHHKEELTDENVNDVNISLNPDNIALVHHRCHNYIHHKLEHTQRNIYIVYGSPLSGKSTFVKDNCISGDLIVDIDLIWQAVGMQDKYLKPNQIKSIVFDIRNRLLEHIKNRFGQWLNAYIIGGYPLQSERERLIKTVGGKEIFIDTPKEICLQRLEASNDRNKDEWRKYIDEWFERYDTNPPSGD